MCYGSVENIKKKKYSRFHVIAYHKFEDLTTRHPHCDFYKGYSSSHVSIHFQIVSKISNSFRM